jgi:sugar lactone lactonase YvrE
MRLGIFLAGVALILCAACGPGKPVAADPVKPKLLAPGSPFHGVHGLRFNAQGQLHAGSVIGQAIYRVDIAKGSAEVLIGPRDGMADDLAFGPDGTLVWTSIEDGILHIQSPGGTPRKLYENMKGVNAISYSPDGKHLYFTLVFYGDALYEADLTGKPPRKIAENLGGLNAFEVAADGMIYGPLYFKGEVVQVNPANGKVKVVASKFQTPAALKLDGQGNAYLADAGRNEIVRVELKSGAKTVVAKLDASLAAVNGIAEIDIASGAVRDVMRTKGLTSPAGLAVYSEIGTDTLYAGDLFGDVKKIDTLTGKIEKRTTDVFQPTHLAVSKDRMVVVSEVFGVIQLRERESGGILKEWKDFRQPKEVALLADGSVVVAETGAEQIVLLRGDERKVVARLVNEPTGIAPAGPDAVYVTERGAGKLVRYSLSSGERTELVKDLQKPEALALSPDGRLYLLEVGAKRISRIDTHTGARVTIVTGLPVGWAEGPSLFRGLAASDKQVYFSSDIENAIYQFEDR